MLLTIVSKGLKSIAANIRKLRLRLGMTQLELAKPAGLDTRDLQTLESGKANPSAAVLIKVADALSVAPGVLFAGAPMHDRKSKRPRRHGQVVVAEDMVSLEEVGQRYLRRVLALLSGNKTLAGAILGVDRRTIYRMLDRSEPTQTAHKKAV